jgi:hypothetical protein
MGVAEVGGVHVSPSSHHANSKFLPICDPRTHARLFTYCGHDDMSEDDTSMHHQVGFRIVDVNSGWSTDRMSTGVQYLKVSSAGHAVATRTLQLVQHLPSTLCGSGSSDFIITRDFLGFLGRHKSGSLLGRQYGCTQYGEEYVSTLFHRAKPLSVAHVPSGDNICPTSLSRDVIVGVTRHVIAGCTLVVGANCSNDGLGLVDALLRPRCLMDVSLQVAPCEWIGGDSPPCININQSPYVVVGLPFLVDVIPDHGVAQTACISSCAHPMGIHVYDQSYLSSWSAVSENELPVLKMISGASGRSSSDEPGDVGCIHRHSAMMNFVSKNSLVEANKIGSAWVVHRMSTCACYEVGIVTFACDVTMEDFAVSVVAAECSAHCHDVSGGTCLSTHRDGTI